GDLLDGVGDGISEPIEVIGFELDDDVVGAGHGIDDDYAGTGVLEIADGCTDGFSLADIGLNKDVTADGHAKSSGPGFLPEGWGVSESWLGVAYPVKLGERYWAAIAQRWGVHSSSRFRLRSLPR